MEGYFENLPLMPLYESFGIKNFQSLEQLQSFTNLMWPEGNPILSEIMYSYFKQVSELENMVKRMVFESFGVEGYYDSLVESTTYRLRLMKYNAPGTDEAIVGFVPHKDYSFVTILGQNDVSGLEIQSKDGKWITVKPSTSSFIVMVGEVFMAWSNDRLHAPLHHVIMTGDGVRYSVAVLSQCEDTVQVPKEMVDDDHPLRYKPFSHNAYHAFVLTKDATTLKTKIKAFCGVDHLL
ncbi:hypothetical protein AQUCO_12700001v1 [Aquilegia coerulea]|uniref:Fe2OG dioxygenase domain-containing protein n=1 Tax=Aquilegia coerulea TaxID=218851 RepID=A0A2G5C1B3_AQUCA|nr:hypothetical protein AQUCO_12700001v1 [Aquilegia coerulea]